MAEADLKFQTVSPRINFGSNRSGFTLVELLVVIGIIGTLVSLLLPAVQSARESARRVECQNNLRQMGLAILNFESARRVLPASGWTVAGSGNPYGAAVGWRAAILPYCEQTSLAASYDLTNDWWQANNLAAGTHRIGLYLCPSTQSQAPIDRAIAKPPRPAMTFSPGLAASDYEALMGARAIIAPIVYTNSELTRGSMFRNSRIRMGDILDGTSNSILIGEASARPTVYRGRQRRPDLQNDQSIGWVDSEGGFSLDGTNFDGTLVGLGPSRTPIGVNATNENEPYSFHSGGCYFLFADGHVQFLSEQIELTALAALITRAAGEINLAQ